MTKQECYNLLVKAKRPFECFGEAKTIEDLHKAYKQIAKIIHPDTAKDKDKYICNSGFAILQNLYRKAQEEFNQGIYGVVNIIDMYEKTNELFSFNSHGKTYKIYEKVFEGEVSDIYRGICDKDLICIKVGIDENDNDLIKKEYDTLNSFSHHSLPIVRDIIKINDNNSIVMDNIEGENLLDIMDRNKNGLPSEVVMWVMERLFSVVGYLHSNFIVHGNIVPENIVINKNNHNVVLTGFSFHIPKANEDGSHYQIKNDEYSAPEVNKTSKVGPESDIYSLGKLAIYMLGGNTYNNGLPISLDIEIRKFIRKLVVDDRNSRPNDAWKLWDEWIELRNKVYGTQRFKQIDF